jgi:hypothetical protein
MRPVRPSPMRPLPSMRHMRPAHLAQVATVALACATFALPAGAQAPPATAPAPSSPPSGAPVAVAPPVAQAPLPPGWPGAGPMPYPYGPTYRPMPADLTTYPAEVPFDAGVPGPLGYKLVERRARKTVLAGLGMLLGGWAFNCVLASAFVSSNNNSTNEDSNRMGWLLIPVVGPAISLGAFADGRDSSASGLEAAGLLLSLDLAFQLAATTVLITGLAHKEKVWQRPNASATVVPDVQVGPAGGSLRWKF